MQNTEIASDVEKVNKGSQLAHQALGFIKYKEENDCIFYKKKLVSKDIKK